MKKKRTEFNDLNGDEGVSPVVGVMLMLVVTIIVAAVVSSFSSGMAVTAPSAPSASLGVSISAGESSESKFVIIKNIGGESLPTKDLRIISTFECPDAVMRTVVTNAGKVIRHTIDGSLKPIAANDLITDPGLMPDYPFTPQTTNNGNVVSTKTADKTFGTAVLDAGSTIQFDRNYFFGFETDATDSLKKYGFAGDVRTHVTIVHIPSSTAVYDNDVVMTW